MPSLRATRLGKGLSDQDAPRIPEARRIISDGSSIEGAAERIEILGAELNACK